MKYILWILIVLAISLASFAGGYTLARRGVDIPTAEEILSKKIVERPLEKYSIENLSNASILPGELKILSEIESDSEEFSSNLFEFHFNPNLDGKTKKHTTGQINIPGVDETTPDDEPYPIIIMLRGYIDQELFVTGDGTRNAATVFAENGFITIAPDFLGYGESSEESGNIFETRFQTYVTVVTLIESLEQVERWDGDNIFLWGHSNGGQIAVTVLEITKSEIPTTLWAPVTKQFPYSVLFYTDFSVDGGKLIRRELAKFEELYDVEKYSLTNYIDNVSAPIQIHQGTNDDAIPVDWTDDFVGELNELDLENEVLYHKYPGVDHNMRPVWDDVVERDIEFFNSFLDLAE